MATQQATPSHVLYVTTAKPCLGCEEANKLLSGNPEQQVVLVQDVKALAEEGVAIPAWLKGTPTVVSVSTREVRTGSAALQLLKELLAQPSKSTGPCPADGASSPLGECAAPPQGGTWDETEPVVEDEFQMEVGCDPESMSSDKVSASDLEEAMRARGIDMGATTANEAE